MRGNWKLKNERYEFIKRRIIYLFVEYDIRCIPISGFELAMKMGMQLIPYSSLSERKLSAAKRVSEDGFFMETSDGRKLIYYNDEKGYERSNMTILHEIGHAVLGHDNDTDFDTAECEAKFFAKYAIAPPPLVHRIHPDSSLDIMDFFNISFQAAEYAMQYYRKWRRRHDMTGKYMSYESLLLGLFESEFEEVSDHGLVM